jgi:hypothetical protein
MPTYGTEVLTVAKPTVCAIIDIAFTNSATMDKWIVSKAMESAVESMGHEVVKKYASSQTNSTAFLTRSQRQRIALVVQPTVKDERAFVGMDGVAVDVCLLSRVYAYPEMKRIGEVAVWGRGTVPYAPSRRVDMSGIMRPQARNAALSAAVRNTVSSRDFRTIIEGP